LESSLELDFGAFRVSYHEHIDLEPARLNLRLVFSGMQTKEDKRVRREQRVTLEKDVSAKFFDHPVEKALKILLSDQILT